MIRPVRSVSGTGAKVRIRLCTQPRFAWHNAKPDLICPNRKHIYTVWNVLYRLHCALCAIHCTENTNTVNKWPISAAASASIYSVGGGVLRILESIWLVRRFDEKLKYEGDIKKIVDSFVAEVTNCKLWMLISSKSELLSLFGAHWLTNNLKTNIWY